jgi:hypothetical protein
MLITGMWISFIDKYYSDLGTEYLLDLPVLFLTNVIDQLGYLEIRCNTFARRRL